MYSMRDYKRVYRSNKVSTYKKLAKMILEQAIQDVMMKGNPVKERGKWYKDAKDFFDNQEYDRYCECAEIDAGDVDNWYEALVEKGEAT